MTPMDTDEEKNGLLVSYPHLSVSSVSSVSSVTASSSLPVPNAPVTVRVATMDDLAFIDVLQKKNVKAVGFLPTRALEGKIALQQILIATRDGAPWGYLVGQDRYFKHDDVGIIYAINIVPEARRSLVAATLLKAQFERSAYGCKLYCCWCAQDLAANEFWEAMGFAPIAFRTGSRTKGKGGVPRVHLFWQKRIRSGDTRTPWWYPSETSGGAIREDRLVLPMRPGVRWDEVVPVVLPRGEDESLSTPRRGGFNPPSSATKKEDGGLKPTLPKTGARPGGMWFAPPAVEAPSVAETIMAKPPRVKTARLKATKAKNEPTKNDPALIAQARELRDRWLETLNSADAAMLPTRARYEVSRALPTDAVRVELIDTTIAPPLLPAA